MNRANNKKYRNYLVGIFAAIVIVISVAGYLFLDEQKTNIRAEKEKYLISVAERKAEQIDKWYEEIELFAKKITETALPNQHILNLLKNYPSEKESKLVTEIFNTARIHFQFRAIAICNSYEQIVFTFGDEQNLLGDEIKTFCRTSNEQGKILFSDFYLNSATKKPQISFHLPIMDGSAPPRLAGTLNIIIDPEDYLYPLVAEWPVPSKSGEVFLSKHEGDKIFYLSPLKHNRNAALTFSQPDTLISLPAYMGKYKFTGITKGADYRNEKVIAAVKNIKKTGWSLIVKEDIQEVFHESERTFFYLGVLILGIIPIAALALRYVWTRRQKEVFKKIAMAEKEFGAVSSQLSNITKFANDAIFLLDKTGVILQANDRAAAYYGYSKEEFLKMEMSKILAEKERAGLKQRIEKILVSPEGMLVESSHLRKNKQAFPVEVSARKIIIENQVYIQAIVRDISERKRAEEKLRISEQKLRTIFSAMDDKVLVVGSDGIIIEIAPTSGKGFRETNEEILNKSIYEFVAGDFVRPLLEKIKETLRTKVSTAIRFATKSEKEEKWFDARISAVNEFSVIMVISDISKQQKAEREKELLQNISIAVSEAENFNSAVFEVLKNICETTGWAYGEAWIPSADNSHLVCMPAYYLADEIIQQFRTVTLNFSFKQGEDLPGRVWQNGQTAWISEILSDNNFPRIKAAMQSSLRAGAGFPVISKNKVVAILCFYISEVRDEDKNFETLVNTVTRQLGDLFRRKKTEENNKIHSHMLDEIGEAVITTDLEGAIKYWNKAAEKTYGWNYKEVLGKKFLELIQTDSNAPEAASIAAAMKEGKNWFGELSVKHKNNSTFPALISESPYYDESGELSGTTLVSRNISDIKAKDAAFNYQQSLFRQLFDNSPLGIVLLDENGSVLNVNKGFIDLFQYSSAECSGKFLDDLIVPKDDVQLATELFNEVAAKNPVLREIKRKKKDNTLVDISLLAYPIIINEKVVGVFGIYSDITSQKEAGEKLKQNEERFRLVAVNTEQLIYDYNPVTGEISWAGAIEQLTGYAHEEFQSFDIQKWEEHIHPEDRQAALYLLDAAMKTAKNYDAIYRFKKKDNSYFTVEDHGTFLYDKNNQAVRMLGAMSDVTEKARAVEALRENENRYRSVVESLNQAYYEANSRGVFTYCNPGLYAVSGFLEEELKGKIVYRLAAEENRKEVIAAHKKCIDEKNSDISMEFIVQTKTGRKFWVEQQTHYEYDNNSNLLKATSILRDIDERKRAEAILNKRLELEKIIASISTRFIKAKPAEVDFEIKMALGEVGYTTNSDRSYLFLFSKDGSTFSNTHEWCVEGISPQIDQLQDIHSEDFPWWVSQLMDFKTIYIPDIEQMPAEAQAEKEVFQAQEIKSLIVVPLVASGKTIGFIGFDSVRGKRKWLDEDIIVLNMLGEIITNKLQSIKAELSLKQSEERFRFALENSPVIVFNQNLELRYTWMHNPDKNFDNASVLGKTEFDLFTKEDAQKLYDIKSRVIKSGIGSRDEIDLNESGKIFYYDLTVDPIRNEKGEITGVTCAAINITERKKRETEIRKLSLGIEQNLASVAITDRDGVIEYINPHFTKITGYSFDEVLGKNFDIIKSGRTSQEVYDDLWDTIRSGKIWRGELLNKKKNGDLFWESTSISPMKNDSGEITNFIAIQEDVTEKKNLVEDLIVAKDKAEEMNRVKSYFFANMSHELRTPLIGILGFSEMLRDTLEYDEDLHNMAEVIYGGGQRLLNTLNLILNISKLEANLLEVKLEDVDILPFLRKIFETYTLLAKRAKLKYQFHIAAAQIICTVDANLFNNIFDNLLNNAIKFTSDGGVELSATIQGTHAIVKVSDTGIGIAKNKQEIIWEEFRQASEGLSRSFEGTGLGLTIAKKYTEAMGGKIFIESEEGKGTTFTVELPLAGEKFVEERPKEEVKIKSRKPEITEATEISERDKTILLVEDDYVAIDVVKRILISKYKLDFAVTGDEALEKASAFTYDAILMDINLRKGMDGAQVTQILRKDDRYKNIPIIALTAFAMEEEKSEFLSKGMSHYLSKPFTKNELLGIMEIAFKEKSA